MARAQASNQTFQGGLSLVLLGVGTLFFPLSYLRQPGRIDELNFPLSSHAGARGLAPNFHRPHWGAIICVLQLRVSGRGLVSSPRRRRSVTAVIKGTIPETGAGWRGWWSIGFVVSGAALLHLLPWAVLKDRSPEHCRPGWLGREMGGGIHLSQHPRDRRLGAGAAAALRAWPHLSRPGSIRFTWRGNSWRICLCCAPNTSPGQSRVRMNRGVSKIEAERVDKAGKRLNKTLTKRGVAAPTEPPQAEPVTPSEAFVYRPAAEPAPSCSERSVSSSRLKDGSS